jgi:hypothetical protein
MPSVTSKTSSNPQAMDAWLLPSHHREPGVDGVQHVRALGALPWPFTTRIVDSPCMFWAAVQNSFWEVGAVWCRIRLGGVRRSAAERPLRCWGVKPCMLYWASPARTGTDADSKLPRKAIPCRCSGLGWEKNLAYFGGLEDPKGDQNCLEQVPERVCNLPCRSLSILRLEA